ncbi:3-phosphoshikimate 1-carboxyvinyltransferase [Olsenella profusa]|uniref:3-phosphoshikimate 1-carboxyvinyltransferase n=1 Tax=Olsenella profusa F0195 TaxID=1125712 RepID=U2TQJ5_9ACTN|nr:3-phosphoshikimate 1-carboxyvinyltransferase [Olsenella profusa]ERL08388.1 3-phosphoshikimate 1-carboxyvinyltransferase [Olsenella profusa F0195]
MRVTIEPSPLAGTIGAIASKSVAHRLLVLAALRDRTTTLLCPTTSRDIDATATCLSALGARVTRTRIGFRVVPIPRDGAGLRIPEGARLDCGESGSTLRFMLPVLCALGGGSIQGHGRLAKRPLSPLWEELCAHHARLSAPGSFPLTVSGPLTGGTFTLPGTVSSQFVTGLLLAACILTERVTILVERPIESLSYIRLTLDALGTFGVGVTEAETSRGGRDYLSLTIAADARPAGPDEVRVEGDWSCAASWLCAGALGRGIRVSGLEGRSHQGDRAILLTLASLGAHVRQEGTTAEARGGALTGRTIDAADVPDLVPPLAAVASTCTGTTRIIHAERLRLKESDRLETVSSALNAMGGMVSINGDGLAIHGVPRLRGGIVDAANDHRIAMMAAVAGATATGPTTILGAECVRKSYPAFFDDFRRLGGTATESE